ncbi:HI0074 family nucleotidyltransferase substrate-binding subunit [Flammeovirga pacifica]|uniref:Nucleotidyltransferase n=1 Tax=Flammeovirga pacifica TaxID=915059 RepID=A0A1S1YXG6_FLAPC|nr:HI0074 family nucleotidyltransferase substrate-binding subunit [Flammeovirga pacifica]OHX65545.1 nucleotidyltransferase [Flammeovirga pacifica]
MDNFKELRWRERFQDLSKSFNKLEVALKRDHSDEIIRAGIIQFFEMTFELSWKTLKDYLESEGYEVKSPRATIQQAYQISVIKEGHQWIDALNKRNLMAHTYDEDLSLEAIHLIEKEYILLLRDLIKFFENEQ